MDEQTGKRGGDIAEALEHAPDGFPEPPALDHDKYLPLVETFDLTEKEKRELLESLWMMMSVFVDLSFETDAVSLACGQNSESAENLPLRTPSMVELTHLFQRYNDKKEDE